MRYMLVILIQENTLKMMKRGSVNMALDMILIKIMIFIQESFLEIKRMEMGCTYQMQEGGYVDYLVRINLSRVRNIV